MVRRDGLVSRGFGRSGRCCLGGGGSWSDMFRLWAACFDRTPSERGMLRVREAAGEGGGLLRVDRRGATRWWFVVQCLPRSPRQPLFRRLDTRAAMGGELVGGDC